MAGLIESEGNFVIPKTDTNNTPTVAVSFHINDLNFAKFLIDKLGYGSIQMVYLSLKAFKLVIRTKEGILDIISLLNGNIRTLNINKKKITFFKRLYK